MAGLLLAGGGALAMLTVARPDKKPVWSKSNSGSTHTPEPMNPTIGVIERMRMDWRFKLRPQDQRPMAVIEHAANYPVGTSFNTPYGIEGTSFKGELVQMGENAAAGNNKARQFLNNSTHRWIKPMYRSPKHHLGIRSTRHR